MFEVAVTTPPGPPTGQPAKVQAVRDRNTANKALALRIRGYTIQQIANELSIDDESARTAVQRALAAQAPAAPIELRVEEVARLDHYLRKLDPKIEAGDTEAVRVALEVSRRRAALLGLDAPQRIDIRTVVLTLAKARGYDDDEAARAVEFVMRHKSEALSAAPTDQ